MKIFISFVLGYLMASALWLTAIAIESKHKKVSIFMKGPVYWIVRFPEIIDQMVMDYKYRTIVKKDNGDFFYINPAIMRGWRWADSNPESIENAKYEVPFFEELCNKVGSWPEGARESAVYCPREVYKNFRPATKEENKEIKQYIRRMEENLPF